MKPGETPLIKPERITEPGCAEICVKNEIPKNRCIPVEPLNVSSLSGGDISGSHRLEGIGAGKKIAVVICDS
jgi:hypothetical protein